MPAPGFGPAIPASERPATYTFDRVAIRSGVTNYSLLNFRIIRSVSQSVNQPPAHFDNYAVLFNLLPS